MCIYLIAHDLAILLCFNLVLFLPLLKLYNMERRPKSDPAFEALGNMDELNASLALAAEHSELAENGLYEMLVTIQSLIIDASALVATPRDSSSVRKISRTGFPTWCTDHIEVRFDAARGN